MQSFQQLFPWQATFETSSGWECGDVKSGCPPAPWGASPLLPGKRSFGAGKFLRATIRKCCESFVKLWRFFRWILRRIPAAGDILGVYFSDPGMFSA